MYFHFDPSYFTFVYLQMPNHLAIGSFAFPCSNRLDIGINLHMRMLFSASGAFETGLWVALNDFISRTQCVFSGCVAD